MRAFAQQPKVSPTSMPANEAEEWLNEFSHKRAENKPNGGIIQSTPSVVFTDRMGERLTPSEHKKAKRQAQKEFKAAMREVAKQEEADKKAIAKKLKEWSEENKPKPMGQIIKERQQNIVDTLNRGETIDVLPNVKPFDINSYHTQRRDINLIAKQVTGGIIKIRRVGAFKSMFIADVLPHYEGVKFSGKLSGLDREEFVEALCSGNIVSVDSVGGGLRQASTVVRKLVKAHDYNVHTVFALDNSIKGWVMR